MTLQDDPSTRRYERGLRMVREVNGGNTPGLLNELQDIAPDLARYIVEFPYGDIYPRSGLTLRQRLLSTVAALTTLGYATPQLKFHTEGAVNVGCKQGEVFAAIFQIQQYAGPTATASAIHVAAEVFRSLSPTGTKQSERPSLRLSDQADLVNRKADQPDSEWVEQLEPQTAELVSIAACATRGDQKPHLRAHLIRLLAQGGSPDSACEVIIQMAVYAGFPAALTAISVAREVFHDHREAIRTERYSLESL